MWPYYEGNECEDSLRALLAKNVNNWGHECGPKIKLIKFVEKISIN
jgi:hypothetical protein